jgi:hypothetical protein
VTRPKGAPRRDQCCSGNRRASRGNPRMTLNTLVRLAAIERDIVAESSSTLLDHTHADVAFAAPGSQAVRQR